MKKFEELKTIKAQKRRIVKDAITQIELRNFVVKKENGYFEFLETAPGFRYLLSWFFDNAC